MAALRVGSKCSHTIVYAVLFRRPAPCPEPRPTLLRWLLWSYLDKLVSSYLEKIDLFVHVSGFFK